MIRDYINHELQLVSRQIDELDRQLQIAREARGPENRQRRDEAESRAKRTMGDLLTDVPPAATYEFLDATGTADAVSFRTTWQEKHRRSVNCLQELTRTWKEGSTFYKNIFESPVIELARLPAYSFVIQFTFTLAQPYISRDEQNFYIIDNPVRKDKIFGLPYVASTSWKGSLRAALWQLEFKAETDQVRRLFGNEKNSEDFRAGRLYFFPTFFTLKGIEIINPQDHKLRVGSNPIAFESVPKDSPGVFTLLYVPFDLIGTDDKTIRQQVADDIELVVKSIEAMLRIYGFGAKTKSGFGLAKETLQEVLLEIRARGMQKITELSGFKKLTEAIAKLAQELKAN